ncbi:hypothetical protein Leryth_002533 [Lithospermum erythrorhizon]|nr:hypothetical protein Leryth_002533 [Lithospermum erythrorhizon]
MKDEDALPVSTPSSSSASNTSFKRDPPPSSAALFGGLFGRGRYKFWALAAILLLAFWSMLTGTVTLRWSAGNLNRFEDDVDATTVHHDLDVLEIEEREKLVKHMWDVYTNSKRLKLPKFWQQAFEAAYEGLAGDDPEVREETFSEIAKMSLRYINLELPHSHSATSVSSVLIR